MRSPGQTGTSSAGSRIRHLCLWSLTALRKSWDKRISPLLFISLSYTEPDGARKYCTKCFRYFFKSSKTLSCSSNSLHLEKEAFPQRHPFCLLPGMRRVDLMVSSSQVREGLTMFLQAWEHTASLRVNEAESREGRRLPDCKVEHKASGPVFCKGAPKEPRKQNPAKAQVEMT